MKKNYLIKVMFISLRNLSVFLNKNEFNIIIIYFFYYKMF